MPTRLPNRETERNRMVDEHIIPRGTVLMIFRALAVGAVPILRRREPELPRPYRTPLYPFVPGFYLLVSTVIVGTALYERPVEGGLGIATVLAGTPLYLLWRRFRGTWRAQDSSRQQD